MDKIERIPLYTTTSDLDRNEGELINEMKSTHLTPYSEPILDQEDLNKNIMISSVDQLINWARK